MLYNCFAFPAKVTLQSISKLKETGCCKTCARQVYPSYQIICCWPQQRLNEPSTPHDRLALTMQL